MWDLNAVSQLSIGVVAVLGLVYVSVKHNAAIDKQQENFLAALKEQNLAFRELEASVRANLTDQLTKNTVALSDVAKVLGRVVNHLDGDSR